MMIDKLGNDLIRKPVTIVDDRTVINIVKMWTLIICYSCESLRCPNCRLRSEMLNNLDKILLHLDIRMWEYSSLFICFMINDS